MQVINCASNTAAQVITLKYRLALVLCTNIPRLRTIKCVPFQVITLKKDDFLKIVLPIILINAVVSLQLKEILQ